MKTDTAIEYADQLLYERTGKHLSDLQSRILHQSWQGRTYGQVASAEGYSEGHVKDVASQLWKALSEALGERITKGNLRSRLINRAKRTFKQAAPDTYESIASVVRPSFPSLSSQSLHTLASPIARPINPHFIGRLDALKTLETLSQTHQMIVIKGEGGIGKTTLAQQFAQQFDKVLELPMAKEMADITPAQSVVAEWLRQHFSEDPSADFGVTLSRLKQHLQQATQDGSQRTVVLIDNLEPALDSNGQFVSAHRHYVELLRMLSERSDAGATVVMTSRDRLCEPSLNAYHYRLPSLSVEAWQQFFSSHISTAISPQNNIDKVSLSRMHSAYGGNAKAMEILCATVISDYEGDLCSYWKENGTDLLGTADLRNLVVSQVDRLQQLDPNAYRVFCRLGCYRYQDQPRLKATAIAALMWDVNSDLQKQTINSLRDRSLLEFRKGDYWLHPVSRAEAVKRLRSSDDWPKANIAAAEYWSDRVLAIVTTEDGLEALEAYYHRMAAEDYKGAATVLLKSRHNQWQQFLPLASSLYRMGLLQPVTNAITQVLPFIEEATLIHSELNNILGDVYWITGSVHKAIACQQQTLVNTQKEKTLREKRSTNKPETKDACERDAYYLKMLTVDAHLSLGLYYVDLWELKAAKEQFEQAIALAAGSAHQAWADKASVGLALVQACLGQTNEAKSVADGLYGQFMSAEQPGQYAYFLQLLARVYRTLQDLEKATLLYERAITFAEAGHYIQVKSKALLGLAVVHRQQGETQKSLELHHQAIALSKAISAKCDLAEAYLQLGLSDCEAEENFERAITLFQRLEAPNQVKRTEGHRQ